MEIEKEKVEVVQRYKYLGVHFDAKLKFDIHAQEVHKKTKKRFFLIKRLKHSGIINWLVKWLTNHLWNRWCSTDMQPLTHVLQKNATEQS